MEQTTPKILSGKPIATAIRKAVTSLIAQYSLHPVMLLIRANDDPASDYYVQNIIKTGTKLGIDVRLCELSANAGQEQILAEIETANEDEDIHGIMLQKPLPAGVDDILLGDSIAPSKDIDCLSSVNLGKIILEQAGLLPCTPAAVFLTLSYYGIATEGKNVVIVGRSAIVGKPLANMLLWKKPGANASVTVCHSRSSNLPEITRNADILIAAIGKAGFVSADMIRQNSVLLDVGINEVINSDGSTSYTGDIAYDQCISKAGAITPVPGGIGTVTSAYLFLNLVKACLDTKKINKSIDDFLSFIFNEK